MKKTALAILALACATTIADAQSTMRLTASKANDYGLAYSLPTTVLDITIETEFSQVEPGEFANYARRYLNATDAATKPSLSATVKSVTITPRGIPNEENQWLMQFKAGQAIYVNLNADGVPMAINTDDEMPKQGPQLPVAKPADPTPLEVPAAKQAVTQEMTMSTSTAKRAQLAAERIFELRSNRNDLISGQADNIPPDGRSMQLALDNLSAQEAALTAMFIGTEKKWTQVATLTYQPGTEDVKDEMLCRISPTDGVVDPSDLSGAPMYISMEVLTEGEVPVDEKNQPKQFPKNGIAYIIPGTAQITITFDGNVVSSQQESLSQLGTTFGLDPKIFVDKKAPAYAIFNTATGGIVTLSIKE